MFSLDSLRTLGRTSFDSWRTIALSSVLAAFPLPELCYLLFSFVTQQLVPASV